MNEYDNTKNNFNKSLSAIYNPEQSRFYNDLKINKFLENKNIANEFIKNFCEWVKISSYNKITGLECYDSITLTNGSVQIFDFFYLRNFNKRFRFFTGEFMYHQAVLKNNLNFEFYENDQIRENDVFIVSVPFTRTGKIHDKFFDVMKKCDQINVPVLLDFCHLPCSKNVFIDLNDYRCIETISFSMSKFFHNAEFLRVGIRFQKKKNFIDDGIDVFNSVGIEMNHRLSIGIANEIIKKYPIDYLWKTFGDSYIRLCKKNNLSPTDNIIIAIDNRNNQRVCVSNLIYDESLL